MSGTNSCDDCLACYTVAQLKPRSTFAKFRTAAHPKISIACMSCSPPFCDAVPLKWHAHKDRCRVVAREEV